MGSNNDQMYNPESLYADNVQVENQDLQHLNHY
jgi:hypothetical protein